jgi:hypothetical protein
MEYLAYAHSTKSGVFAGAVNYLRVGDIQEVNNLGVQLNSSYSPNDVIVTAGYANTIREIPVGISVKYISSSIENEKAQAYAADIGTMYKIADNKVSLGLVVQNLGTSVKYINESFSLPMNVKAGASYKLKKEKGQLITALDINMPIDNEIYENIGLEYQCFVNESISLSPRLGYKTNNKDLGESAGLTAGIGFGVKDYKIDYALGVMGDLGQTHNISIGIKF